MRLILRGTGVFAVIIALLLLFGGEGLQRAMMEMATAAPYALIVILLALFVAVLCAMQAIGLDGEGRTEERRTPPQRQLHKEPEKKTRTAKKQAEKTPATRRTGKRTRQTTAKKPAQAPVRRGGRKN